MANQFANTDNKTAVILIKFVEPLLGHGHTLCMEIFYNSPELSHFLKSKETDCVFTLHANRKMFLPW
jgi:hypothetical protein